MQEKTTPAFICIGAQRAGTTWLHNCLAEHPDLCLPEKKEIHFFNRNYDKGIDWYQSHFAHVKDGQTIGELTPNYYHADGALERIKQDLPNVKLIYILREPVSRSFSQYELYKEHHYQGKSFEDVFDEESPLYSFSLQGKYLEKLYQLFEKEQVLVLFYDQLMTSPNAILKEVLEFLNVRSDFTPQALNKRVNAVVLPELQAKFRRLGLGWIIELIRASPFAEMLKNYFRKKPKSGISKDIKNQFKKYFRDDVEKIEQILGVGLNHWK